MPPVAITREMLIAGAEVLIGNPSVELQTYGSTKLMDLAEEVFAAMLKVAGVGTHTSDL